MFSVTYLAHQGWLIATDATRILIDPLLTPEYSPGYRAAVYPPRRIDLAKFPAVDAVVLSHEHSDHVNVPSLQRLDRRIPVILPERSSLAIRALIERLGFQVITAHVGDLFSVGDLAIRCFAGEYRDDELEEEWANLQLLVWDRAGDGSFFTYVDGWPTPETFSAIQREVGRLGVFCHVNNVMDWSCLEGGHVIESGPRPSTLGYAGQIMLSEAAWWEDGETPEMTVVCGPGLVFLSEDAWLNQVLRADSERVCAALRAVCPERRFSSPLPGETFRLRRGRLHRRLPRAPFLRTLDPTTWPSREVPREMRLIEDFAPASGRSTLKEEEWRKLLRRLDELGSFFYGRSLFRTLHALDGGDLGRRKSAFAIVLRCNDAGSAYVCEYQPSGSRFTLVECARPMESHVAGLECWATDLLGVLDGSLLPQRLLGHLRTWSFSPLPLSPLHSVWRFFDFLHRPDARSAFYESLLSEREDCPVVIAAGASAGKVRRRPSGAAQKATRKKRR